MRLTRRGGMHLRGALATGQEALRPEAHHRDERDPEQQEAELSSG